MKSTMKKYHYFKYLGSVVTYNSDIMEELKERTASGNSCVQQYNEDQIQGGSNMYEQKLNCLTLKVKAVQYFETFGSTR
jgi:hypothetical protein